MEKTSQRTYTISLTDNKQGTLLSLARESADVYNQALDIFWKEFNNGKFLSAFDLQKYVDTPRNLLQSDSYIGSLQLASKAISTYFAAKAAYEKKPETFTGRPMPPVEHKTTQLIIFKKSAIRVKDKFLLLSTNDRKNPLKYRWNPSLSTPVFASISWDPRKGWRLNLIIEKTVDISSYVEDKILAIDLGIKRIATSFDGEQVVTYSGKLIQSLTRLRNKINADTRSKLDRLEKHSLKYRKIRRANRKVVRRIEDKMKDILHKTSRTIVNYCEDRGIGTIVFGDCSSIHSSPNLGKKNNQKVSQGVEQRLLRYVQDKFEVTGGKVCKEPENYTSRTCPACGAVKTHSPQGRTYKCPCGYEYDRDGVGAINIHRKVSFGNVWQCQTLLDVVGRLTRPIGWRYVPGQDCLAPSG